MKEKIIYPSEAIECEVFANWLRMKGLMFTYIPNDTYTTSWSQKHRNKKFGVSSGVPDFMIIVKSKNFNKCLVFIEMKKQKGGKISDNQKIWIDAINEIPNIEAFVCNGADQAITIIETFI